MKPKVHPVRIEKSVEQREEAMQNKTAQWILWAITMIVFSALAFSGHFELLALAIVLSSLVWYTVVPRTTSR